MRKLILVLLSFLVLSTQVFQVFAAIPDSYITPLPKSKKGYENYTICYIVNRMNIYFYDDYIPIKYHPDTNKLISYEGLERYSYHYTADHWSYEGNNETVNYEYNPEQFKIYYSSKPIYDVNGNVWVGELGTLPKEVTEIPGMVGQAVGSVIYLAALPILIIILAVLLVPRLMRFFLH